ncbi:class I SAM-dependent methyltransferase [Candidatus Uhrbacteria bacterium]|nr:class I SAM-dependent methyltransferase [Candidatus Uhrbacteria bacterium]
MNFQSWSKYESAGRWASYFTQVDEVLKFAPQTCLEIGVGNGIVTEALRKNGVKVTTLDPDQTLEPDIVGSVESLPCADRAFDVVLCAEVLEHLPYEKLEGCLKEIARVSKSGAVISIPHWGRNVRLILDLPLLKVRKVWRMPFFSSVLPPGGEHFWELGRKGVDTKKVRSVMAKNFRIEKDWLSAWMPYHRFFRLRK